METKFGNKMWGMLMALLSLFFVACSNENEGDDITPEIPKPEIIGENLIICNEGNWQSDNGQLSYYDGTAGVLTNKWFRQVNGSKLGDTPNDIIQVNDTLIAIAVNWSNIIQYIHPDGTACGATENVPNNRRMCTRRQLSLHHILRPPMRQPDLRKGVCGKD